MNVFDVLREKLEHNSYPLSPLYDMPIQVVGLVTAVEIINQVEQEYKPKTNGDRIRSMSDEELADEILQNNIETICERISSCTPHTLCEDYLDRGELIPEGMCKQCLMNWLGKEVEI